MIFALTKDTYWTCGVDELSIDISPFQIILIEMNLKVITRSQLTHSIDSCGIMLTKHRLAYYIKKDIPNRKINSMN
jgi:hypothetical protein